MIQITRTNSDNKHFQLLVAELDADLRIRDGDDHAFYAQFNKIDAIQHVIVAYDNDSAIGCGAIKQYAPGMMEVKRMYVPSERRGEGIASAILKELEKWALELNAAKCILETGKKQPEAIGLYRKNAYTQIPNYGQYEHVEDSVCFEKVL